MDLVIPVYQLLQPVEYLTTHSRIISVSNEHFIISHSHARDVPIAARVRKLVKSDPEVKKIASAAVKTLTHALVRALPKALCWP